MILDFATMMVMSFLIVFCSYCLFLLIKDLIKDYKEKLFKFIAIDIGFMLYLLLLITVLVSALFNKVSI